ncbi:class I SAM-dependent RNA methyltransferase [Candidatus Saccharibacteria bacterium]|nr:class I SAM-dependent RNA methyltransferase [Candidatus Saccharibacteria bacterium]
MAKKSFPIVDVTLDKIIGGGQALGLLESGKKIFVWGGLPGETVRVQITKQKSSWCEGIVTELISSPSPERVAPKDPESYLSTSPWQIMTAAAESFYKSALIEEAFELHDIVLPNAIDVYGDKTRYGYRNKIEFSFWYDTDTNALDLAFYRRGTHGKIAIDSTALAHPSITLAAKKVLAALNNIKASGRDLKTLLIRCNQQGDVRWQLYVKNESFNHQALFTNLKTDAHKGEVIYSNPKSPASVITTRLTSPTKPLTDTLLNVPFSYATEGFFQINLPVYSQTLQDIKNWLLPNKPVVDMYSGVGTIGLTVAHQQQLTLVEINEHAVREMRENIIRLNLSGTATAVLAASENALEHIKSEATIIVDPPRAGLHDDVIKTLLLQAPARIIYLSCNPVTQARDIEKLAERYGIKWHRGYNYFPATPHIEHLVVLDLHAL